MQHRKSFKNVGFTLAEVLITIGIIGVVSAPGSYAVGCFGKILNDNWEMNY